MSPLATTTTPSELSALKSERAILEHELSLIHSAVTTGPATAHEDLQVQKEHVEMELSVLEGIIESCEKMPVVVEMREPSWKGVVAQYIIYAVVRGVYRIVLFLM